MNEIRRFIDLVEAPIEQRRRRVSDQEFIKLVQDQLGSRASKLSLADMAQFAEKNGVQIPTSIRHNPDLKLDAHHWNLSGRSADDANVDKAVAQDLGIDVEAPAPEEDAEVRLRNVQKVRGLVSTGKVYLFGRKIKGAFFRIQGADEMLATLERAFSRELATQGDSTMEEQYEDLRDRVKLVASGRSSRLKALLLTGAPRSGKTFTVMETLEKGMGYKKGKDFVVQKGKSTELALYQTLIAQIHGLTIYDDCDSIIDNEDGVNMLKNALDSGDIRDVGYNAPRTTVKVDVLPDDERNAYVDVISKILRVQEITNEEYNIVKNVLMRLRLWKLATKGLKKKDKEEVSDDDVELSGEEGEEGSEPEQEEVDTEEMDLVLAYVAQRLPNKIDFDGRIIFISNLTLAEWPDAIVQRAFAQDMNFRDDEMIEYIDRIKDKMDMAIDNEQKQEVWDFVKDLWRTGKLKGRVSFGLAFEAFDLRLTPNWQRKVSKL